MILADPVNSHKPDVVTVARIGVTRISQTYNQLHRHFAFETCRMRTFFLPEVSQIDLCLTSIPRSDSYVKSSVGANPKKDGGRADHGCCVNAKRGAIYR
jgi:hypothetical protein